MIVIGDGYLRRMSPTMASGVVAGSRAGLKGNDDD